MSYARALRRLARAVAALSKLPTSRSKKSQPTPKVSRRERRQRQSVGAKRRWASSEPPRSEPDVTELVETFAPPPEESGPITPVTYYPLDDTPAPKPEVSPTPSLPHWAEALTRAGPRPPPPAPVKLRAPRGSCRAIDALTGRACKLPEHASGPHAHERGQFTLVATSGRGVARRGIDEAAWRDAT